MPELPDLIVIESKLRDRLIGATISTVEVPNPVVMRCIGGIAPSEFLVGRCIESVFHRGPFVVFGLDAGCLAVFHPMLAGRFSLDGALARALCLRLHTTGPVVAFHDERQMAKVYLATANELARIPKFNEQGTDILSEEFTAERLNQAMGRSRRQVRAVLMDQTILSSIGNAYADEILFDAGIHPKTPCSALSPSERERLHAGIRAVMLWGIEEVARANAPLHEKVRGHMKVRNKKGKPCPRCGTTIRRESVLGYDTFFCPKCQPPARAGFIDWSKTVS